MKKLNWTLLVFVIAVSCKEKGTEGGNPEMSASSPPSALNQGAGIELSWEVCRTRNRCISESIEDCQTLIQNVPNIGEKLMIGSIYSTFIDIQEAEKKGEIEIDNSNFQDCKTALKTSSCYAPEIYNALIPGDLSNIKVIFEVSPSCLEVFKKVH